MDINNEMKIAPNATPTSGDIINPTLQILLPELFENTVWEKLIKIFVFQVGNMRKTQKVVDNQIFKSVDVGILCKYLFRRFIGTLAVVYII